MRLTAVAPASPSVRRAMELQAGRQAGKQAGKQVDAEAHQLRKRFAAHGGCACTNTRQARSCQQHQLRLRQQQQRVPERHAAARPQLAQSIDVDFSYQQPGHCTPA